MENRENLDRPSMFSVSSPSGSDEHSGEDIDFSTSSVPNEDHYRRQTLVDINELKNLCRSLFGSNTERCAQVFANYYKHLTNPYERIAYQHRYRQRSQAAMRSSTAQSSTEQYSTSNDSTSEASALPPSTSESSTSQASGSQLPDFHATAPPALIFYASQHSSLNNGIDVRDLLKSSGYIQSVATQSQYDALNSCTTIVKGTKENITENCPICLHSFEIGEILRQLRCDHILHRVCADQWLIRQNTCPLCRSEVMR